VAITVVCTGTCEPERSLTDALARGREPYIVLRTRPGRAVAGPLVVPPETSCLRCADLWRAEADPVWPRLAAQLAHRQAPDDPVLDAWVTALGLAQIVAFLYGEAGELRSRTLTLASDTGRTTLRVWPQHPHCACHAPGRVLGGLSLTDRMGA
jgi:bacteriocin biosynthesis cyclodehydratase domain-containing protein